jgi:hypothetical protein
VPSNIIDSVEKVPPHRIKSIIPSKMEQLIKKYAFFAGGSVAGYLLGIDFSDYDLYFRTKEDFYNFSSEMSDYCGKVVSKKRFVVRGEQYFGTDGKPLLEAYQVLEPHYSYEEEKQYYLSTCSFHSIGFINGDPYDIINTFDLSCSQAAFLPQGKEYITTTTFNETRKTKMGTVEQFHAPLKTANRMLKYSMRGITFSYGQWLKMYMVIDTEPDKPAKVEKDMFAINYRPDEFLLKKKDMLKRLEEEMEKANV